MTKHSPLSLIERAAEAYDFAALLRAPQAPAPVEEDIADVEPAPLLEPEPETDLAAPADGEALAPEPEETLLLDEPFETAPEPVHRPARLPALVRSVGAVPAGDVVAIDRAALSEKGFILPDAPVTGLAEEFRLVKRQLLAGIDRRVSLPDEKRRTVLISSGQPGEGKSFCATNLALSLAGEREVEVLLIDGDVSKPDILATLGIASGGPGLVDALADPAADPEEYVIRTDVPGLSILPAGRKTNNVPELLASERTRAVLARLAAGSPHRVILFDSPPALMASSAAVLAGHVGQVLVVVRADRTTEADLRETIELLSACDHVGLLLNGAALSLGGRRFGAYEGYGDGED